MAARPDLLPGISLRRLARQNLHAAGDLQGRASRGWCRALFSTVQCTGRIHAPSSSRCTVLYLIDLDTSSSPSRAVSLTRQAETATQTAQPIMSRRHQVSSSSGAFVCLCVCDTSTEALLHNEGASPFSRSKEIGEDAISSGNSIPVGFRGGSFARLYRIIEWRSMGEDLSVETTAVVRSMWSSREIPFSDDSLPTKFCWPLGSRHSLCHTDPSSPTIDCSATPEKRRSLFVVTFDATRKVSSPFLLAPLDNNA